jgi:hypothetical protein
MVDVDLKADKDTPCRCVYDIHRSFKVVAIRGLQYRMSVDENLSEVFHRIALCRHLHHAVLAMDFSFIKNSSPPFWTQGAKLESAYIQEGCVLTNLNEPYLYPLYHALFL